MKKLCAVFVFILSICLSYAQQPMNHNSVVEINESEVYYEQGKFLLKLHDRFAFINLSSDGSGIIGIGIPAIKELNLQYKVKSVKKLFPFVRKINLQPHDLTTIYEIEYDNPISPVEIAKLYSAIKEVEFAEPDYIASILVNPNDPYYRNGSQTYHSKVKANDAWELTTGDASQIIGIIDTGVDWEHEDLAENIWKNTAEIPDNGIDDDNNGFVDDVRGWDFVNDDNNPKDDNSHGTHVAGIAGAKTNNDIGIAGITWNAKLMPIKVMQSSGRGSWSDIAQGAAYSAENGATIINMSLGGYSESLTMKTTLENAYHYSVLVAAAGNDGICIGAGECLGMPMFPACYPWVLGVQAATSNGGRATWSNFDPTGPTDFNNPFGYNYEVLAPGSNIYSTIPGNKYRYLSGTSMATPIVSGAVALIKSYLPNISTEELFARIIQASGSGVLDIEEAITLELIPDLRLNKFSIVDTLAGCDRDGVADAGETVLINIEARNYGGLAQNVKGKLRFSEFEDTSVLIINDSTASLGNVSAYARVNNDADPFKVTIPNDVANDRDIVLQLELSNETNPAKFTKNIIITAQNGEELKGYNPGLTHLTANRYYLLTENAVFDSLIIDPGVTINAYSNTNIGISYYLKCNGKVDSLINLTSISNNNWLFFKSMTNYKKLNFSYSSIESVKNTYTFQGDFTNCIFQYNKTFRSIDIIKSVFKNNGGGNNTPDFIFSNMTYSLFINNNTIWAGFDYYTLSINNSCYFNSIFSTYITGTNSKEHSINKPFSNNSFIFELEPNYFGSTKQSDIDFEIFDYFEDPNLPIINCSNFLTEPHPDLHGHAWQILLNDENPYYKDLDPFGNETVKFDVFFSRSMDTTITPFLTFGVREPYTQKAVVDSSRWLNWKRNDNIGDTYYNIQVSTDSTFTYIDFEKNDVLGLDYKFNINPDKQYFWKVRYKNGTNGDWQNWSDVSNFYTKPTTLPDKPIITHPQEGDDDLWTSYQIQWKENQYAINYFIQADKNNDFSSPIVNDSVISNYYNITGLTRGNTYYIRVKTKNMYGISDWSDVVSFDAVGNTPRGPELISPINGLTNANYYIKYKWEKLDWVDEYDIQFSWDSSFVNTFNQQKIPNNYCNSGAYYTQTHYWRIRGIKGSIFSNWSEIFSISGNNYPEGYITNIISPVDSSKLILDSEIFFKWINPINTSYCQIQIFDSPEMKIIISEIASNHLDSTFCYSELLNIGKYYWRIRPQIKYSWGSWSDLHMFEITKDLDPKPLLCVPTNNMKWYDTTLTFKWNNAPGANTVYNARWQAYHTMDFTTGDGLQKIRVAGAKDNEGFEIPIEWNRFEFEVQATAALSNEFIAEGKVGKIDLEWGMPDVERDILGFNMYRFVKKDSVTWSDTVKVNNILIVDSTYTDYNIIPDSTYYYIYRIVRTTLDEGEDSRMVSASAYPTVLDPPALLYPPNDTTKMPVSIIFDWDEPFGATKYIIQISRNIDFTDIFINQEVIESQYSSTGLSNRTNYYWRVKANGIQGTSAWSVIRHFVTIPVIPDVPVLVFPTNNSVNQTLSITFDWNNANEADSYHFQLSLDSYFGNIIEDITNIYSTEQYIGNLALNKTYYWRVRSKNDAGVSNWSNKWLFTTDTSGAAAPPDSWSFDNSTGNSSTIVIPKLIQPKINGRDILPGDAVGVFYLDNGQYKSAGYSIWEGKNMALIVHGNDEQTLEKDGFFVNESYKIKLWDSRAKKEFLADVVFSSGNSFYTIDGYSILGKLESSANKEQLITLQNGWNLVSTYINPVYPLMDSVWNNIVSDVVIVKNNDGNVYIPEWEINDIGDWITKDGYQVYMSAAKTLSLTGTQLKPEITPISLDKGWNIVSYLRNSPIDAELGLETIVADNSLIIAKNNTGQVYIPMFEINDIGNLEPGQGYQMYLSQNANLTYPANSLGKAVSNIRRPSPKFLLPQTTMTGNNSVLVIKIESAENGNEIGVYTNTNLLVGSGVVYDGLAVITIWGDDSQTSQIDGALNSYELKVISYELKTGKISEVHLTGLSDVISKELVSELTYSKDKFFMANAEVKNNSAISLNIKPNPANDVVEIEFTSPDCSNTEISIYSSNGKLVDKITDKLQTLSGKTISYNVSKLSSGEYTFTMTCGSEKAMRKVMVVR
jgi:subtilisin family serine protease